MLVKKKNYRGVFTLYFPYTLRYFYSILPHTNYEATGLNAFICCPVSKYV